MIKSQYSYQTKLILSMTVILSMFTKWIQIETVKLRLSIWISLFDKVAQVSDLDCFCVVVIDGLDRLKKENAGARDGIRFLESEFRKGNRWVIVVKETNQDSICLILVSFLVSYCSLPPCIGIYAARRSQVAVLKGIKWNGRTLKPGKPCFASTITSVSFITYWSEEFDWSSSLFLGIYTRWWTVVVN